VPRSLMPRKLGLTLLLALFAAAAVAACGSDDDGDSGGSGSGTTVKVTAISDLSGPTADTQVPYEAAQRACFDRYNENLSDGQHRIQLDSQDDKYDAAQGLNHYRNAVANGSVLVIGPNASATHPAMQKAGMTVPVLSGLTTTVEDPFLWNFLPRFTDQAKLMVNYAKEQVDGELTVAGLYFDVPSGVEFGEALKEATEAAGGRYLGNVTIAATEAAGDWRAQAQRLAELKPKFVGVLASANNPQTFLPAMDNAGLKDAIVGAVTPLGLYKENWTKVPESLGEKFFVVSSISPADLGTEAAGEVTELAEAAGEPDYANNIYFVQGVVACKLAIEAINKAGDNPTPESVNEALGQVSNFETGGLNPPLCFGPDDTYGTGLARPIRVDLGSGKFVADGEFEDYAEFVSEDGTC